MTRNNILPVQFQSFAFHGAPRRNNQSKLRSSTATFGRHKLRLKFPRHCCTKPLVSYRFHRPRKFTEGIRCMSEGPYFLHKNRQSLASSRFSGPSSMRSSNIAILELGFLLFEMVFCQKISNADGDSILVSVFSSIRPLDLAKASSRPQIEWPELRKRANFEVDEPTIDRDTILKEYAGLSTKELNITSQERWLRIAARVAYYGRDTWSLACGWAAKFRPDLKHSNLQKVADQFFDAAMEARFDPYQTLEIEEQSRAVDIAYRSLKCLPRGYYQETPEPEPLLVIAQKQSEFYESHPHIHESVTTRVKRTAF